MPVVELPTAFGRYRDEIEQELRSVLAERDSPFYRMLHYQLGWVDDKGQPVHSAGGKRLRPVLCLLTCEALGADRRKALPATAALELVHNFSLIHDDIQDGSPERHHRPSVWWVWGPAQAINAGDAAHALGRLALFRLPDVGASQEQLRRALRLLDEAALRLCEGQYLDMAFQERMDVTVDAYLEMARGKTGALMSCSLALGALLSGGDEAQVEAAGRAGMALGLVYQMHDDVLDLWGERPGEAAGGDILTKKKSLPIVYALEKGTVKQKRELGTLYLKRVLEPPDVARVAAILDEVGACADAQKMAERHFNEAMEHLRSLPLSESGRGELEEVGRFMLERTA
ncbi:MAG: polyprenyl synthetase family protein [Chloroflexota bacterium]|nr:polyprenyl synthetase family protein [Chloroflexota bacterium]